MAADWTLRAVQKLQARLASASDPEKQRKYLRKLSALPITADILAQTGVRKTVKGFRKHQLLGPSAKDLAAQWKKLARGETKPGPHPPALEELHSRKRPRDALPEEEETPWGHQESWGPPASPDGKPKQHGNRTQLRYGAHEATKCLRVAPASLSDLGSPGDGHQLVSAWYVSPPQMSVEPSRPRQVTGGTAPCQSPGVGGANAFQGSLRLRLKRAPHGRPAIGLESLSEAHSSSPEDRGWVRAGGQEGSPGLSSAISGMDFSTNASPRPLSGDSEEEQTPPSALPNPRGGRHWTRTFFPALEVALRTHLQTPEPAGSTETQRDLSEPGPDGSDVGAWPDPPSPRLQANCSPTAALQWMSFFQTHRSPSPSPQTQERAAFPGSRVNSKTPVYAGPTAGYRSHDVTFQPHCTQVPAANASSGFEVNENPYSVLDPLLHKCTPDQLDQVEKFCQGLLQEMEQFWKMHCHREFRSEKPEGHESWRQMYLRLREARAQRLQELTARIQSAQARKPQGRQTKVIAFTPAAKPSSGAPAHARSCPGTSDSSSTGIFPPAAQRPANAPPSTSRAPLTADSKTKKTTVKKTAPLMVKAIRDYKNRFSRR